jgi:hypothetical protein
MARLKRKKIDINEDSLKSLMQEVYNDSHQIRSTLVSLFNKWNAKVKEQGEIAATGKEIVNLINALSKNQDQKINLIKVLNEILYNKNQSSEDKNKSNKDGNQEIITEEMQDQIKKLMNTIKENGDIDLL